MGLSLVSDLLSHQIENSLHTCFAPGEHLCVSNISCFRQTFTTQIKKVQYRFFVRDKICSWIIFIDHPHSCTVQTNISRSLKILNLLIILYIYCALFIETNLSSTKSSKLLYMQENFRSNPFDKKVVFLNRDR